ncbi:MAG: prolyl aminopeptidase [Alphaproteobacteria bacterium]|nr:prolyl aminopeptidase [Alphaproteobacteria bacterium]
MPSDRRLRAFYPPIEPYRTGILEADEHHRLYYEESGDPDGIPVLFLHGGPGAGASAMHRRFFDPERYRIVILDQRGAGRSKPLGSIDNNTTDHLIDDIEALRRHLGIEKWLVFGGSWGSTLALAYGQAHPEACLGFILRGIFLGSAREIDWFLYGMKRLFPEHWSDFAEAVPEAERADLMTAYEKRLFDPDPAVHMPAAVAWSRYEGACSTLRPNPEHVAQFSGDVMALGLARIEWHFFRNGCFREEGALLAGVERIRHLPAIIVQGRYDVVCPPETAFALRRAWPEADFLMVDDAGHAATEPGTRSALIAATDDFLYRLG